MAGRPAHRTAGRQALWTLVVVALVAAGVGAAFAARDAAQARNLLRSQRLRIVLRLTRAGGPADLMALPGIEPDGVEVRPGSRLGARTEVRTYGGMRVTVRFAPTCPEGLVTYVEGKPPAMAWPPGRGPEGFRSNLRPGSVVPLAATCGPSTLLGATLNLPKGRALRGQHFVR